MRYSQLLRIVGRQSIFETPLLAAGNVSAYQAQRQLTDWTATGKVSRLRRGLYVLPEEKRLVDPHPFAIANRLVAGSYVSLEMALSYYDLIPEHVAVVTSVTTGRPRNWENEFGRFRYRHIHTRYFFGVEYRLIAPRQYAFIAYPEKALLDLIYLRKRGVSLPFLEGLRLQNLERLNVARLEQFVQRFNKPKLQRALKNVLLLAGREEAEYTYL